MMTQLGWVLSSVERLSLGRRAAELVKGIAGQKIGESDTDQLTGLAAKNHLEVLPSELA